MNQLCTKLRHRRFDSDGVSCPFPAQPRSPSPAEVGDKPEPSVEVYLQRRRGRGVVISNLGRGGLGFVQESPDKRLRAFFFRVAQYLAGRSSFNHNAAVHKDHLVGCLTGEGQLMGNYHHGPTFLG